MHIRRSRAFILLLSACVSLGAQTDIEYARTGGISLRLDAYPAQAATPSPAVILVHGGAWVKGDRRNMTPLIAPLTEAGFAVFNITYRLAPDFLFPAAVDDVRQAVRFVRGQAARFSVDPNRVALVGESAGAQLASLAALGADSETKVQAVVSLYGPTDFVQLAQTSSAVPEALRRTARDSLWGVLVLGGLQSMSPIAHVQPGMPPFLFIHGTDDRVVPFEQSTLMCEAIRRVNGSCEVHAVEDGEHNLRNWENDAARASYKASLIQWLKIALRTSI